MRTRFDIAAVTPAAFMRGEPEPAAGDNDASWLLKFYETFKVRSLCRIIASCLTYTVSHIVSTPLCSHRLCTWCLLFATVRERLHRGVASNACCEALLSHNWLVQPCKIHDVHEMSFCI